MSAENDAGVMSDLIYLLSCSVNQEIPDRERVEKMDLAGMHREASRHMVAAAVAVALRSAGVLDPAFDKAEAQAVRKVILLDTDRQAVTACLEAAGIWYMPLKGAVLKDLYPVCGMREMSDVDMLIDASRAEDVKEIMESLGFYTKYYDVGQHDVYHKKPISNFEMHRGLYGSGHEVRFIEYYRDVKERLIKDEGNGCGYHFSNEDFYAYMITHAYKHFSGSGTGLRSLLDTYIYLKKIKLDQELVAKELKKLGIDDFEASFRDIAWALFAEERRDVDRQMLDYIINSGTYGTLDHFVDKRLHASGGSKLKYMFSRLTVPVSKKNKRYDEVSGYFKLFYKHKILLPFLPFYRIFRGIKNGRLKAEMKTLMKKP